MKPVTALLCAFLCVTLVYAHPYNEIDDITRTFAQLMSTNIPTGYFPSRSLNKLTQIPVEKTDPVFEVADKKIPVLIGQEHSLYDVSKLKTEQSGKANSTVYEDPNFGGLVTNFQVKLIKHQDIWSRDKIFPPATLICDASVLSDYRQYNNQFSKGKYGVEIPKYTLLSYKCPEYPELTKVALLFTNKVNKDTDKSYSLYSLNRDTQKLYTLSTTEFVLSEVILKHGHNEYLECDKVHVLRDDTKGNNDDSAYVVKPYECE